MKWSALAEALGTRNLVATQIEESPSGMASYQTQDYRACTEVSIPVDRTPPLALTGFISSPCIR